MKHIVEKLMLAASALTLFAAAAFADIKGFNAAVGRGDYKAAAAEARTTWAAWDKSHADTATVAREFGFAALISGDYEGARQYGRFLVESGATLPKADDQPTVSSVLYRFAEFRLNSGDAQRAALRDALAARNAAPGFDMTSVIAWEGLYNADWNAMDWDNAHRDATAALDFLNRSPGVIPRKRAAEVQAAAALFLDSRVRIGVGRNDIYETMAGVHDRIVADIDAAKSQSARDQLWPLKWRAEAWTLTIGAFLDSSYAQIGSNISTALKQRDLLQPAESMVAEDPASAATPLCKATLQGPAFKYPYDDNFKGMVGGIVARVETGTDGKAAKVVILASVPAQTLTDDVIETYSKWRLVPDKGVSTSGCRLNSRNNIVRISLQML